MVPVDSYYVTKEIIMKKVIAFFGLGLLSVSPAIASDALTMHELLNSTNPLPLLKKEAEQNARNANLLCEEIKKPTFYDLAQGAKFGVIKRNDLISYCSGTVFEKAVLKPAVQGIKKVEEKQELPQLRHVEFKKGGSVEEEHKILEEAKEVMMQNALALGKKKEVEEKIQMAEVSIKAAQEHYDNLKIAIIGMREDLKEIHGFKHFNPNAHDEASPEVYLETLHAALAQESGGVLDGTSMQQLKFATDLLRQANENLATARLDLEKINRELLSFVH